MGFLSGKKPPPPPPAPAKKRRLGGAKVIAKANSTVPGRCQYCRKSARGGGTVCHRSPCLLAAGARMVAMEDALQRKAQQQDGEA